MKIRPRHANGRLRHRMGAAAAAILLATLPLGCGKRDETHAVTDVRERPESGAPAPNLSIDDRLTMGRWVFVTPLGWEELPPAQLRDVGWRVAGKSGAECSFTALSGGAGGLAANVNRWRKQMSLAQMEAGASAPVYPQKTLLGQSASYVELVGTYKGMGGQEPIADAKLIGLVVDLPMATAFLKLTGPASVVDAEIPRFFALASSLRMKGGGARTATPPSRAPDGTATTEPDDAPAAAPFQWTAPAEWKKQGEKPMRLATFVPAEAPATEVTLTMFAGGPRANIDRWRRDQMGQGAFSDEEFAKLKRRAILGGEAVFAEIEGTYTGMGSSPGKPGWMLAGMALDYLGGTIFVKMTGPAAEVHRERERFQAFCESFHE